MIAESFVEGVKDVLLTEVTPGLNVAEVVGAGVAIGTIIGVTVWGARKLFGSH